MKTKTYILLFYFFTFLLIHPCNAFSENPNWDCTENAYSAYTLIMSPYEFIPVIGIRTFDEDHKGNHAWLEYRKCDTCTWEVYDPSLVNKSSNDYKYTSIIKGAEALSLLSIEQYYHALGFDAEIWGRKMIKDNIEVYEYFVIFKRPEDIGWIVHGESD